MMYSDILCFHYHLLYLQNLFTTYKVFAKKKKKSVKNTIEQIDLTQFIEWLRVLYEYIIRHFLCQIERGRAHKPLLWFLLWALCCSVLMVVCCDLKVDFTKIMLLLKFQLKYVCKLYFYKLSIISSFIIRVGLYVFFKRDIITF